MILSRQKSRVEKLAATATTEARKLRRLRRGMRNWKQQTFARPLTLILAFSAGFAVSTPAKSSNDRDGRRSLTLKALETSFFAWRLLGRQVATGANPSVSPNDGMTEANIDA